MGYRAVEQRLQRLGRCLARRPASSRLRRWVKTAQALEQLGAARISVPPNFVADSLIDHFPVSGWGLKMLLPRVQTGGRTLLADAFGEAGVRVVEVAAYESGCPDRCRNQQRPLDEAASMPSPSAAARPRSTRLSCWNNALAQAGSNAWRG